VPAYESVVYEGLYEGVDLKVWGLRSHLKYEFHVSPGADFSPIAVRYEGIAGLSLDADGSLVVSLPGDWGQVVDDAPYVYQVIDGQEVAVGARFVLLDSETYGFELTGTYDPAYELVIDPNVAWSTYLGGSGREEALGVAADGSGGALVAGYTISTDFEGRTNSYHGGDRDAFVARVNGSGTLLWATYLGGSSSDYAYGVASDGLGGALVAGYTYSTDFEGRTNSHHGGESDAFVARVSGSGTLLWATYLGGSNNDRAYAVASDGSGGALVAGYTYSTDFEGRTNSHHGGESDAFVARVSGAGTLLWATYLGGSDWEWNGDVAKAVASDGSGGALVAGYTSSTDFEGRTNSHHGGGGLDHDDAFVARVSGAGSVLWATYLGGSDNDRAHAVASDGSGGALVAGRTSSREFEGRTNSRHGSGDAFVARVSGAGTLIWATYLGGSGYDYASGVAWDGSGGALVAGQTRSRDFEGPRNSHHGGWEDRDAFVAWVSGSGTLSWATYLGGSGYDHAYGVAWDGSGGALVAGYTESTDFEGRTNSYHGGDRDAFVVKIVLPSVVLEFSSSTGSFQVPQGETVRVTVTAVESSDELAGFQLNFGAPDVEGGELVLANWTRGPEWSLPVDDQLASPEDCFVGASSLDSPNGLPVVLGSFDLTVPLTAEGPRLLLSVASEGGALGTEFMNAAGEPLEVADYGDVWVEFVDTRPPQVQGVEVNAGHEQRSLLQEIRVSFDESMAAITAADLVLTNLGADAPADPDQVIALSDEQLVQNGRELTIQFDPQKPLPEGAYRLEILPTATDIAGNPLDGNGDGVGGESFVVEGNRENRFFELRGDFNGSGGVNIFDFALFREAFGQTVPPVSEYFDLNGSGAVNILDFGLFKGNFGRAIVYPEAGPAAGGEQMAVDRVMAELGSPAGEQPGGTEPWEQSGECVARALALLAESDGTRPEGKPQRSGQGSLDPVRALVVQGWL